MRTRTVLIGAGVLAMTYAVVGALTDPDADPVGILVFLVGALVGHDALWMVVVLLAGAAVVRLVGPRHRPAVRIAAISAAAVTVVAFPLVLGAGRVADNPSVLPLPYGRNLAAVLLLIAAVTVLTLLWRTGLTLLWRTGRGRKTSERSGGGGAEQTGG